MTGYDNVIKFLKQNSTKKGIVAILTAVGVGINPEQIHAVIAVGISLIGCLDVFFDEDKEKQSLKDEVKGEVAAENRKKAAAEKKKAKSKK